GHTRADESLCHMAGMSPVITTVSGFPSNLPGSTVVSSVLGKQLEKSRANSGSSMRARIAAMYCSTISERKRRSAGRGRPSAGVHAMYPAARAGPATSVASVAIPPRWSSSLRERPSWGLFIASLCGFPLLAAYEEDQLLD